MGLKVNVKSFQEEANLTTLLQTFLLVPQYHTFLLKNLVFKSKTGISMLNLTTSGAIIDLKNRPGFTDF